MRDGLAHKLGISADGKWILFAGTNVEASDITSATEKYLWRVSASGGAPEVAVSAIWSFWPIRCARTMCIWGEPSSDKKQFNFFEFNPLNGKGRQLATVAVVETYPNFDISPDGSLIAWPITDAIRFLAVKDGKMWDVKYKGSWTLFWFDWAADGKGVFAGAPGAAGGASLLHIDLQGDVQVLWKTTTYFATWAAPSPDGRYLAIWGGSQDSNVSMMEDF